MPNPTQFNCKLFYKMSLIILIDLPLLTSILNKIFINMFESVQGHHGKPKFHQKVLQVTSSSYSLLNMIKNDLIKMNDCEKLPIK